jgi:hypothetical protein
MTDQTPVSRAEVFEAIEAVLQLLTCCIRVPENQLEAKRAFLRRLILKDTHEAVTAPRLY